MEILDSRYVHTYIGCCVSGMYCMNWNIALCLYDVRNWVYSDWPALTAYFKAHALRQAPWKLSKSNENIIPRVMRNIFMAFQVAIKILSPGKHVPLWFLYIRAPGLYPEILNRPLSPPMPIHYRVQLNTPGRVKSITTSLICIVAQLITLKLLSPLHMEDVLYAFLMFLIRGQIFSLL